MEADHQVPAAAAGNQLPPESIHAKWIEEEEKGKRAMSVVRLRIARTGMNHGRGTGFVVVNTANKLVIMTCGHSFKNWAVGTKVDVTFHDGRDASAEAVWVSTVKEVALLLLMDTSPNHQLSAYPAVDFSYDDVKVGDFLVTLGHPHGMPGHHDVWNNFGFVTREVGPTSTSSGSTLPTFGGDYASGPGASGSPVFGLDGGVVGICIRGGQDAVYTLPVGWIRETLKDMPEVKKRNLQHPTIREMIELCYVHVPPPQGHSGAGSSGGSDAQVSGEAGDAMTN